MCGGAVSIVSVVVVVSTNGAHGERAVTDVAALGIAAMPLAIGIGILKYRLYDIDRLISRTISYLIMTGLLAGVFIGIVALATQVLPFSSPVAVAASTLAAAALFNPLRKRVQHLVDRRFNRARYDAEAIVAAFTLRLRDAVDLDTVRHERATRPHLGLDQTAGSPRPRLVERDALVAGRRAYRHKQSKPQAEGNLPGDPVMRPSPSGAGRHPPAYVADRGRPANCRDGP